MNSAKPKRQRSLSLGRFILLLSLGYLALALALVIFISNSVQQRAIHDLSQEDARQSAELIFQSLYGVMRRGWDKELINQTIERLNQAAPEMSIRAFRGLPVIRQYGDIPGESVIRENDPVVAQVLQSGEEQLITSHHEIRYLYPLKVQAECLRCHQAKIGEVNGVIDIRYPIKNLKVSLQLISWIMIGYFALILAVLFIGLFFKLKLFVVRPILRLSNVMSEITRNADLSRRVQRGGWIRELHNLADYFNRMLSTLQEFQAKLEELSVRDPLTNLYNRRRFEHFLEYEVSRARRHQHGFCLIMIDLDNFKHINDTYGHPIGDLALKRLALLLNEHTRNTDVVARLGGDEFAVILPETPFEQGNAVAEKLRREVAGTQMQIGEHRVRLNGSFGVVSFPENGDDMENLNIAMDLAMYRAKNAGKNCVATLEGPAADHEMELFRRGEALREAMEENRLVPFLQPIVDAQGSVFAYEVLARLEEEGHYLPAAEFIHLADELGLAKELDHAIFDAALVLQAQSDTPPLLFINLSPRTIADASQLKRMAERVAELGVNPGRIVFEITEREALPRISEISEWMEELRQQGFRFAPDDFGSGFSSFLYLKYLPVDFVKIEGSFIRQIASDPRDRIMVEQIAELARKFALSTIAEMVEDKETHLVLRQYGIDFAQGYYYGLPALAEEVIAARRLDSRMESEAATESTE